MHLLLNGTVSLNMHRKDQTCVNNVISLSASGQCDHRDHRSLSINLVHITRQYNHCLVQQKMLISAMIRYINKINQKRFVFFLPFKFFICG